MKRITPIILNNSLNVVRGGLTKAVFTRANTLVQEFGKVYIFTFLYQQNHDEIKNEIYEKGLLDKRVEIINLFEDMKPCKKRKGKNKCCMKENGLMEFKDQKQTLPSYRYYNNGVYEKYKRFEENGQLLFIDYMSEGRHRTKREEYDQKGLLKRIRHMDLNLNKPAMDRYLDLSGDCYISIWNNPKTGKPGRVALFGENKEFDSLSELQTFWIEQKINKMKQPVIMTDNRSLDNLSLNVNHRNLKRIAVVHNNHFEAPFDTTSTIRSDYQKLFEKINQFSNIVFLTDEQKKDVECEYGKKSNLVVIPHPATQTNNLKEKQFKDSYNPHLAVTLARYQKQKRLDEAIRAFQLVVKQIPTAEYHIFGFGKEKESLEKLIAELDLDQNVKLKGFTSNAMYTYKSAACSILTSDYEGFGMVLTESLAAGTPAVTYDGKYGPRDIVRDNIDGYIVKKGDQAELASKIIKLMNDNKLRNDFSKNAVGVTERFSVENYKKDWISLLLNT